jgi:hypothetical protein
MNWCSGEDKICSVLSMLDGIEIKKVTKAELLRQKTEKVGSEAPLSPRRAIGY